MLSHTKKRMQKVLTLLMYNIKLLHNKLKLIYVFSYFNRLYFLSDHTMCMTVHNIDSFTGRSLSVSKRCARENECTTDTAGCVPGPDGVEVRQHT